MAQLALMSSKVSIRLQKNYQFLEHTADIGITVKGKELKDIFVSAAMAMFDIIAQKRTGRLSVRQAGRLQRAEKRFVIKQKANNLEELLVNWLNELLSLSAVKGFIFYSFKIGKLSQNSLAAIVIGSRTENYHINTEIKAATRHELKLEKIESGWKAQVIFDV